MQLHLFPMLFALFVWWFSTGVIIYLDGLPRRTFKWSFLGGTILMFVALWGLASTRNDTSIMGAYLAFTWGTLAWGWQEMSFYMGYVTGPRTAPCPEGCGGIRHFGHAIQTSLYHELAVIAAAVAVLALTWGGTNQIGTWTFLIMWWMHQSAKLNVFFGVRNLSEEFLPEHLQFLRSFLTKKPMNAFFPISVTISTIITALLFQRAFAANASDFQAIGFTFLGFLMALAILEHWLLVMPFPSKIWDWGLRSRTKQMRPASIEVVAGFLGAGKTTFVRRLLATADPNVRTVVLVNDFGAVGIDGSLLNNRGADVVELPNGCICCSLRSDLGRQIREVVARFAPDRLLIEPSGVAEVTTLLRVLSQPSLADAVKDVRVYTLIDAGGFLQSYARMPEYFNAQANIAPVLIVNKADLATPAELKTVEQTLQALNPAAQIVPARYGVVADAALLQMNPLAAPTLAEDDEHEHEHEHDHEAGLGLVSWSGVLAGVYDETALRELLGAAAAGKFGELLRMKGIAQVRRGWVNFDLAGGHPSITAFAAREGEAPRIVAIGNTIEVEPLETALQGCRLDAGEQVTRLAPAV
ncbi:MAG: putative photosynthetic complex assembly protein PuhE [Kouleothrix sp.]